MTTFEKFLPFHAACSQGHLDVLKLLIEQSMAERRQVYFDSRGNRYLASFDLNATDVNDQSGLFAAIQANRYEIVQYLLDLKFKRLKDSDCEKIEAKSRQQQQQRRSTISSLITGSKSVPANLTNHQSQSFFDHLKSVFLDTKSYDPYVINYTTNPESIREEESSDASEIRKSETDRENVVARTTNDNTGANKIKDNENTDNQNNEADEDEENQEDEPCEYFNPLNIDTYSKFGTTCLHEAIRCRNVKMVELLLNKGADANQQVFDFNSEKQHPTSNCLIECLKVFSKFSSRSINSCLKIKNLRKKFNIFQKAQR